MLRKSLIKRDFLFTSESVAPGHPDKVCDQISDSVLDLYLTHDPNSRVAVETMATPNKVIIAGETRGPASVTKELIEQKVRDCIKEIGYEQQKFHWNKIQVENLLINQSSDIALGVDAREGKEEGAGDQGIMFGFACNETPTLMPAAIYYANLILYNIFEAIKKGELKDLGPDAKSQVTLLYSDGKPVKATSVVVSIQHKPHLSQQNVKEMIRPYVEASFPNSDWMCREDLFYVNPTGIFVIGGPESDSGLTGRKIIVDTYGGAAPHGGGAFSGKDPSKVDRSAAYATRHIAKNLVAAGICNEVLVQVSYAIGVAQPMGIFIDTYGTAKVKMTDGQIAKIVESVFDMRPYFIEQRFKLRTPIYSETAAYGHMGRKNEVVTKTFKSPDGKIKNIKVELFTWEKLDYVSKVKAAFKIK